MLPNLGDLLGRLVTPVVTNMGKNFYAVKVGRTTGVYNSW